MRRWTRADRAAMLVAVVFSIAGMAGTVTSYNNDNALGTAWMVAFTAVSLIVAACGLIAWLGQR